MFQKHIPDVFWISLSKLVYFTLHCVIELVLILVNTNLMTQCKVQQTSLLVQHQTKIGLLPVVYNSL
jgi:hypothetical protein